MMRGLVADQRSPDDGAAKTAIASADACERICGALTRVLGATGSRALLTRALSQAQAEHPALENVVMSSSHDVRLQGVATASAANGEPAVVAGLETVLSALLANLGRLIGRDMVARLVAQSASAKWVDEVEK
jgi:hypothetical protein